MIDPDYFVCLAASTYLLKVDDVEGRAVELIVSYGDRNFGDVQLARREVIRLVDWLQEWLEDTRP